MKYIVFSFDDGLLDFYENAYPLFRKYGFLSSINVIPGFSDKSINSSMNCMSLKQIARLYNEGFEIVNHTNSHLKNTTWKDIMIADEKLKSTLGKMKYGLVLPYSQKISEDLASKISNYFLYIADFQNKKTMRPLLLKLRNKFNVMNKENFKYFYSNYGYIYKISNFATDNIKFHRLPILKNTGVENVKYFLRKMKNNDVVVLMFHSIVKNKNDIAFWEDGKWTINELEELLCFLKNDKSFKVCKQKELIEYAKKR